MTTPGLLKIKIFLNKGYDTISSFYDIANKTLSLELNYIVDMVMELIASLKDVFVENK